MSKPVALAFGTNVDCDAWFVTQRTTRLLIPGVAGVDVVRAEQPPMNVEQHLPVALPFVSRDGFPGFKALPFILGPVIFMDRVVVNSIDTWPYEVRPCFAGIGTRGSALIQSASL